MEGEEVVMHMQQSNFLLSNGLKIAQGGKRVMGEFAYLNDLPKTMKKGKPLKDVKVLEREDSLLELLKFAVLYHLKYCLTQLASPSLEHVGKWEKTN